MEELNKRLNKIRQERKDQKLNLFELARKANMPMETVKKILNGYTKNPRIESIIKLEKAVGIYENNETDEEIVDYFCHVLPQNAVDFWDEKGEFVRFKLSSEDWQTAFKMLESLAIDKAGKKYWNKD